MYIRFLRIDNSDYIVEQVPIDFCVEFWRGLTVHAAL